MKVAARHCDFVAISSATNTPKWGVWNRPRKEEMDRCCIEGAAISGDVAQLKVLFDRMGDAFYAQDAYTGALLGDKPDVMT